MRLMDVVALNAGGPGSGCHGDNCGRRASSNYKLPESMHPSKAKTLATPSWKPHPYWKNRSFGGVVVNNQGQFLLREPANHFDGYHWTFPKGKPDSPNEHPVDTAIREVGEESGHHTGIFGHVPGTYAGTSGTNNYYLMRSNGENPDLMDRETQGTRWVSYHEAKQLISQTTNKVGRARDLAVLDRAQNRIQMYRDSGSIFDKIKKLFR